mmetsp:Transcript_16589/g.49538  ORF Transcript_16589/g.49538 Transcript_16589/m.49538 type:complete len:131 (-) Transcript_16589:2476-2868(-)
MAELISPLWGIGQERAKDVWCLVLVHACCGREVRVPPPPLPPSSCSASFSLAHIFRALDKFAPSNRFSLAAVNAAGSNSSGAHAAEASLLYPPGGAGIPASEKPQCQLINVLDAQWVLCTVSVEGWYPVW